MTTLSTDATTRHRAPNMPLAEYLQIHPAGAGSPAGANYFLNLEGVAIESSPSFGKKPELKNMTLFDSAKKTTWTNTGASRRSRRCSRCARAPARKRVPRLDPDTLLPSTPSSSAFVKVPAPPPVPRVHYADSHVRLARPRHGAQVTRVVRTYDVIPGSEHTLEASGRDIAAVKAVLLVNAVCTVKPEPNPAPPQRSRRGYRPCSATATASSSSTSCARDGATRTSAAACTESIERPSRT